jgi:hypothetical protein
MVTKQLEAGTAQAAGICPNVIMNAQMWVWHQENTAIFLSQNGIQHIGVSLTRNAQNLEP